MMGLEVLAQSATADPNGTICLPIWAALGIVGFPTSLYYFERRRNAAAQDRTEARLDRILAASRRQYDDTDSDDSRKGAGLA